MSELVLRKSITIHAPSDEVWRVITSPDSMRRWMLVVPEFESEAPLETGDILRWKDESGEVYLTGTVVELDPPRRFVLELDDVSWPRTPERRGVTYALTLSQVENRTRVELVFGDLAVDPEGQQWYSAFDTSGELDRIKELAENPS